jgi:hypothetical protein
MVITKKRTDYELVQLSTSGCIRGGGFNFEFSAVDHAHQSRGAAAGRAHCFHSLPHVRAAYRAHKAQQHIYARTAAYSWSNFIISIGSSSISIRAQLLRNTNELHIIQLFLTKLKFKKLDMAGNAKQ